MLVKDNMRWNQETDVLVVGLGGAGAVAAITAHDKGARVCVLEKQFEADHMTNTSMGGGMFIQCINIDAAVEYMTHLNAAGKELQWSEGAVVRAWVEYASHNTDWLKGLGGHVISVRKGGEHRNVPGYESLEIFQPAGMGYGLMKLLKENIGRRSIGVMYDTPAQKLLTNQKGEVVGVNARKEGKEFNIRALRAVIMTLGGFEFDEEMKLNYLKVYPSYFYGSPANTGDGIRMVQDVGATLWHMNCCSARLILKFDDFPIPFAPDYAGRSTSPGRPIWKKPLRSTTPTAPRKKTLSLTARRNILRPWINPPILRSIYFREDPIRREVLAAMSGHKSSIRTARRFRDFMPQGNSVPSSV